VLKWFCGFSWDGYQTDHPAPLQAWGANQIAGHGTSRMPVQDGPDGRPESSFRRKAGAVEPVDFFTP